MSDKKKKKTSRASKPKDDQASPEQEREKDAGKTYTVKIIFPQELYKTEFSNSLSSTIAESLGLTPDGVTVKTEDTEVIANLNFRGYPKIRKAESEKLNNSSRPSVKPLDLKSSLIDGEHPVKKESQTARELSAEKESQAFISGSRSERTKGNKERKLIQPEKLKNRGVTVEEKKSKKKQNKKMHSSHSLDSLDGDVPQIKLTPVQELRTPDGNTIKIHNVDDKEKEKKTKKQNRISLPLFGKGVIKSPKSSDEGNNPVKQDKHVPRSTEGNVKTPTHSPRGNAQLIDPEKIERNWQNIPKKVQQKVRESDLKESDFKEKESMDALWEVIRWLYPDHFVQYKHVTNPTMDALVAMGEKIVHELDVPLKKLYKFQEISGSGGYGRTTIAKDLKTKEKHLVALKKVKHARDSDKMHNMIEVGALSACDHPNIVKFIDAFIESDSKKQNDLWIAMEYMQGGTLREASEGCQLTEKHIAFFARELSKGIKYLHKKHWVHRDLKSSNVMIDIQGKIKLIDFGLLADVSAGPRAGCVGTPYWIAPEMIKHELHSYPADIWSLGVCILELLLGHPPYYPNKIKCIFKVITEGLTPIIPKNISEHAKSFLTLCLNPIQTERPTAKDLLKHEWVNQPGIDDGIKDALDAIFLSKQLSSLVF